MLFLRRDQAPISGAAWSEIDEEATRTLRLHMGARRLVDFVGPRGWNEACVNLGTTTDAGGFIEGVEAAARRVQPLLEIRVPFTLARAELEDVDRGKANPDLDAVVDAAKVLAHAEGKTMFHGHGGTGVIGIADGSPHDTIGLEADPERLPGAAADAVNVLRDHGIEGPYGIALGPDAYARLVQAPAGGGYPALDRLRNVLSGPVVWAPALDGGVVVSVRGGDNVLHVGQDASVGFRDHTEEAVRLFLVETFTLLGLTPEAAVRLRADA